MTQSIRFKLSDLEHIETMLKRIRFISKQYTSNETIISEVLIICSEIAHNIVIHGDEGEMSFAFTDKSLEVVAEDSGEGFLLPLESALNEGVSSKNSLGCGLPAIFRLSDDLRILTSNTGTQICCTKGFYHERTHGA